MPITINTKALRQLLAEDIEWLRSQPACPERDHLVAVAERASADADRISDLEDLVELLFVTVKWLRPAGNPADEEKQKCAIRCTAGESHVRFIEAASRYISRYDTKLTRRA